MPLTRISRDCKFCGQPIDMMFYSKGGKKGAFPLERATDTYHSCPKYPAGVVTGV